LIAVVFMVLHDGLPLLPTRHHMILKVLSALVWASATHARIRR
jgi:hypothetical protein